MKSPQPDKPEFFVSRRGKQVGIHQLNLNDLDIDEEKKAITPPVKQKLVTKTKAPRQRTQGKRRIVIAACVIAALLALPIAAGELVAAEYRSGTANAKKDLDKFVAVTVLPAQKKTTVTADQLRSIADSVNGIVGHMCRGGFLDNAAQLYPRAKAAHDGCKESQRGYASLVTQLHELGAEAYYMEKLDAVIKPVTAPITDAYAVIGAQQTSWQEAAKSLKNVSPPSQMKAAHNELVSHITAIADAWTKLNTANDAQDAAGFTEAEKSLTNEYEAIRDSSAQLLEVLHDTQGKIRAAYVAIK